MGTFSQDWRPITVVVYKDTILKKNNGHNNDICIYMQRYKSKQNLLRLKKVRIDSIVKEQSSFIVLKP